MPSSRSLLASFASSDTTDRYLCPSADSEAFTTVPYACTYSHAAQSGGIQHLAVSTEQGVVYVWDTSPDRGATVQRLDLPVHGNGIFDVQWSMDDKRLATASADHTSRVLDVRTGAILAALESGHVATVKTLTWDPTHDSLLATGGRDGVVCLWDIRTSAEAGPAARIAHAHEELLAPGQRRGKKKGAPRAVTGLLFSTHAPHSLISAGTANGALRLWDLRSCSGTKKRSDREASTPARLSPEDPTARGSALGRGRGLTSLTSGSGNLLYALGCDSRIHAYEPGTLAPLRAELGHDKLSTNSFYSPLALSDCGRWAAAGGAGGSVVVFDIENVGRPGKSVASEGVLLRGHGEAEVTGVSWAQGALATCADDGTVRVWRDYAERRSVNGGVGSAELVWAIA
ncbi:WD40 repeat-like protein [Peniophora sp. CONT]|nr:WD40 repeat-like protein [Peniophora sp. CONT]